jgi:Protein kinase domain
VVGTPSFMSPEQAAGREVGPLSDVFSLGAVLAFAATGRKPFGAGKAAEVLERVVSGVPGLEDAPAEVRPLIERCLAKDPGQRPAAAALLAEVTAVQSTLESLPGPAPAQVPPDVQPSPEDRPRPRGARPRRSWRPLITASAITGILAASGATGYGLTAATQHQPDQASLSQMAAKMATAPAPARAPAAPAPQILHTFTYQQGDAVVFEISYADPGHNAEGFGFVGVDGSDWAEQSYSFSNPASGIVEADSVAYPLTQGCGTGLEYTSTIKAWIWDSAGVSSKPVVIHLACTT